MTYCNSDRVDLHKGGKVRCVFCGTFKFEREMCSTKHLNCRVCLSCWKVIWDPYSTGRLPKNYQKIYKVYISGVKTKER